MAAELENDPTVIRWLFLSYGVIWIMGGARESKKRGCALQFFIGFELDDFRARVIMASPLRIVCLMGGGRGRRRVVRAVDDRSSECPKSE